MNGNTCTWNLLELIDISWYVEKYQNFKKYYEGKKKA